VTTLRSFDTDGKDYQRRGFNFVATVDQAGLLIDMGLGKTAIMVHACALADLPRPILLVGPIRVIETVWEREAKAWVDTQDLSFSLVRVTPAQRAAAMKTPADVYLTNRELLAEVLEHGGWQTLIIDESTLFKNASTKGFKILRKHLPKIPRRFIMTGTPTPNSLLDLWAQIFILDLGERLGKSFYSYRQRFFRQTDWQGFKFEPMPGAEEKITQLISDIIFRVENATPSDAIHNEIPILLPRKARQAYEELEDRAMTVLADESVSAATAAAAMMKLRQVASGFVYDDNGDTIEVHREKIDATRSVLDETGSPVIVVYNFVHELAALKKAFPHGVEFSAEIQEPWDRGEVPLMWLHPQSGGHGLNLQYGGHTMVIFSGSFSYEHMSQTMARIDRQGQKATPVFHYLVGMDTIDEMILQVLRTKEKNQTRVLARIRDYAKAKLKGKK
jgi:SNF2 family DNA or RNA helicase